MPTVDLLVIGGGIHGTCVARDAALRGLSVVLVEKDDLASGTSSRSSKLIHGGLRYLETRQFGLVREALRERAILLETAPALVRPVQFLLPYYKGDSRPRVVVRAGLWLYDALSGAHRMPGKQEFSTAEALAAEPGLPREGLLGAAGFPDAQMDDAGLVVANAIAAAKAGAVIRTRVEVTKLTLLESSGAGRSWRAELAAPADPIEASAVVNATGPWLDVMRQRGGGGSTPKIRRTRGTHIVVPRLSARPLLLFSGSDRRVFFVLPWGKWSLVGTTDKDDGRAPDDVTPTVADIRYLWDEITRRWPDAPDPAQTTVRAFAGLRPLVQSASYPAWDVSREAQLIDNRGMISLAGGKFTTARHLAERAVDVVVKQLGVRVAPCSTATAPLAPGENLLGDVSSDIGITQVLLAMQEQFAKHTEDVVFRRSRLWLDASAARAAAPTVTGWMAERLGWDAARREAEVARVNTRLDDEEQYLAAARETLVAERKEP
jgi:glycerol-3-phosphate dehydrogenase